jgi:haloalkane dehalogenase
MRVLRTPDERFAELPDLAYEPRYVTIGAGLRMAFVEAGPSDSEPILLLHGEPTWSLLYRSVIASLAEHGLRAIAPRSRGFSPLRQADEHRGPLVRPA